MDELRSVTGTVFDIQHYCIHDGPGIRTDIFVKGCPLHCLWCANPESRSPAPQLMYRADKCVGCAACAAACPGGAISIIGGKAVNDRHKCLACGDCVSVCAQTARSISGKLMTAGEALDAALKDKLFFGKDGGVTVTGGEPLYQPEFTRAVLSLCKGKGINTAIETSGFAVWEKARPIFELCDTVLHDIKQMDNDLHLRYTRVPNTPILEGIRRIDRELGKTLWIRLPLIPGYNDSDENYHTIGAFIAELEHCARVDILPYHNMGTGKLEQLEEAPEHESYTPTAERVEQLKQILAGYRPDLF